MITINKNRVPQKLLSYSKLSNANYNDMPADVKDQLKNFLLRDQDNLCAYCMRTIRKETIRIEHYIPQSFCPEKGLDYSNLLGVCDGNEKSSKKMIHACDVRKKSKPITINPLTPNHMDTLFYKNDGTINTRNINFTTDLDDTLNLNNEQYVTSRRIIIESLRNAFVKKCIKKINFRKIAESKLHELNCSRKIEYHGVHVWFYENKIH